MLDFVNDSHLVVVRRDGNNAFGIASVVNIVIFFSEIFLELKRFCSNVFYLKFHVPKLRDKKAH